MNKTRDYVMDVLGYDVMPLSMDPGQVKSLPLIIRNKYAFYDGDIQDQQIVFMHAKGDGTITAQGLRKHIDLVHKTFGKQIVFVAGAIESYNRRRLIDKRISFIVPRKQMYIPALLIDLQEFATESQQKQKSMTPAAQYLLLYHLLEENLEGIQMKNIAKKIRYGQMTVTRAATYLEDIEICQITGTKEKGIKFFTSKQELWKEVEPYMVNPVKKTIFISYGPDLSKYNHSNINALSKYTMIGDERKEYYALTQNEFKRLTKSGVINEYGRHDGEIAIEIWKYDPAGLSKDKYIDQLSLYLIFRKDEDERIQMVINQMMEEIQW